MSSFRDRLVIGGFIASLGFIGIRLVVPAIYELLDSFHALDAVYHSTNTGWLSPWTIAGVTSALLLYLGIAASLQAPSRFYRLAVAVLTVIFMVWAILFIRRSSFIALDQQRYYCLFDDAMISMRYGWNFAHGLGLVWNPGERVEGYTNFLMTVIMAIPTSLLDKKQAVLAVQVFGILCLLSSGWLTLQIAKSLSQHHPPRQQQLIRLLSLGLVYAYYPLAYWAIMGMETGLLTVLLLWATLSALQYEVELRPTYLWRMSIALGLAYLTRPDSALAALWIILYVMWSHRVSSLKQKTWREPFIALGLYGLFILGMGVFRWLYYGELVPNTYILKMTGMPFDMRLANGWGFVQPYLQTHGWLYGVASLGLLCPSNLRRKLFCLAFPLMLLGYSIWVGGDPWPYWRFTAPGLPLLLVLVAEVCVYVWDKVKTFFQPSHSRSWLQWKWLAVVNGPIVLLILLALNSAFLPEAWFQKVPYQADGNRFNVNRSLALIYLTTPEATVGVFGAGVIPYFTGRPAVDFFGKSDPRIARLPPDLSRAVSWAGMFSVPGHNKYDLEYSIKFLQPTYIEAARTGRQDLTEWARDYYVEVTYKGVSLLLLRESPTVYWDRVASVP